MGLASIVISPKILSSMPVLPLTTQQNLPEQNLENHNQSKLSGSNRILWEINDWAHGSKALLNVTICVWAHATSPIFRGRFASPKYLYQCYILVCRNTLCENNKSCVESIPAIFSAKNSNKSVVCIFSSFQKFKLFNMFLTIQQKSDFKKGGWPRTDFDREFGRTSRS